MRPTVAAVPGFAPRNVSLGTRGRLVVRAVTEQDVDGLLALFAGLDPEDRYRRFFSSFHPDRAFVWRMTTIASRGGLGLLAVVADANGVEGDVVGEASFTPLPNGDGEFALTVSRDWRGWLGPYLLDALVSAARERGVPNLEADVLVSNHLMLAVARSRGYVTMDHPDWTMVRIVVGAASPAASWPGPRSAPRLLVEGGGGRWHAEEAARAAGLHVLVCPGPTQGRPACPALSGQPCPLAAGADAIVVAHPPDEGEWSALAAAHAALHPGVLVRVELGRGLTGPVSTGGGTDRRSTSVDAFVRRLIAGRGKLAPRGQTTRARSPSGATMTFQR